MQIDPTPTNPTPVVISAGPDLLPEMITSQDDRRPWYSVFVSTAYESGPEGQPHSESHEYGPAYSVPEVQSLLRLVRQAYPDRQQSMVRVIEHTPVLNHLVMSEEVFDQRR